MTIVVASTMARYVCDREDTSLSWLNNAEAMRELSPEPLEFFAALELDGEGEEPFSNILARLAQLEGRWIEYCYGDGREFVDTSNRLDHICMGRNAIINYAMQAGASHILFLDADMEPPADCIGKLHELQWPIVGGHVPTYNLSGPKVIGRDVGAGPAHSPLRTMVESHPYPDEWDVQMHMNTAGFLLVARNVFSKIRWRWSIDDGMTDDPCYFADAERLGYQTYVRHDVTGQHYPTSILPIEHRFPERDMSVKP